MGRPILNLIFRAPNERSFSIEKVFNTLIPVFENSSSTKIVIVPERQVSVRRLLKNLLYLLRINKGIFHITGDIHYCVFSFPAKKTILTIHDCVFLEGVAGIKKYILKKIWLDWPVRYVNIVTTISEKSKVEIIKHTRCDPDKIVVISNPLSETIVQSELNFNSDSPSILFIGTKPNKNLENAIKGLEGIRCKFLIIGVLSEGQKILLQEAKIDYSSFVNLTDNEIAEKYCECDFVLFPSYYEGFGLPIIEAQFSGRPIITSNLSPLKEVAGDGACLVDPMDPDSIRKGIEKVILDAAFRNHIIEAGLENVEKYKAGVIANQYLNLYRKLQDIE